MDTQTPKRPNGLNCKVHKIEAFDDPVVVIEILSTTTANYDQQGKLIEYQALPSVDTILFVDPDSERVRIVQRTGAEGWADNRTQQGDDVALPALELVLPHREVFARD
jgi:Uma2 family endonuclease